MLTAYVPNSRNKDEYRVTFDLIIRNYLKKINTNNKPIIYCGDLNVVHSNNDIYNTQILTKGTSPGTKTYERENFNQLINLGYVDSHRHLYPDEKLWTWWDVRSRSREKDRGWRLDYFLTNKSNLILNGNIHKDIFGSDHCPISLEINT